MSVLHNRERQLQISLALRCSRIQEQNKVSSRKAL